MKEKRFHIGSVAVLFSVVAICMAIFCTLTMMTAISDAKSSQRYGEHLQAVYRCENLGQLWLSQVDAHLKTGAALPENTVVEGSTIRTEIISDGIRLEILLETSGEDYTIRRWSCATLWESEDSWSLWQ